MTFGRLGENNISVNEIISWSLISEDYLTISICVSVTGVSYPVAIHVFLITVRNARAVITIVSNFIAIFIFLISVVGVRAVVL